jgi:transporter family-2 protein
MIELLTILIGVIGGLAVAMQAPMIGTATTTLGSFSASLVLHLSGTLASVVALALARGENIARWQTLPWYIYLAGVLGVVVVTTIGYTSQRLGAVGAITLTIVGQLIFGIIIDHFGWLGATVRPIDLGRVVGVLLLIGGAYLIVRPAA